ncbi:MAG: hypothetical protein ACLPTQ_03200 [Terriglobales bacterium]
MSNNEQTSWEGCVTRVPCSMSLGTFGVDDWLEAEGEVKDTRVIAAAA